MKFVSYLIVVLTLASCSAGWHLKRAIAKQPSILTEGKIIREVRDTLVLTTEKIQFDTIVDFQTDTILVQQDNASAKLLIDTLLQTVYVEVVCDADTIYVETITEQVILQPDIPPSYNWKAWIMVACMGIFLLGVLRILGK